MDTDSKSKTRTPFKVRVSGALVLMFVLCASVFAAYRYKSGRDACERNAETFLQGINRGVYASVAAGGSIEGVLRFGRDMLRGSAIA